MNFKEMTLLQLKAYAKEKGIRGVSTLKKDQLVERLMASEKAEEKKTVESSAKKEAEQEKKERTHRHVNHTNNRNNRKSRGEQGAEHFTDRHVTEKTSAESTEKRNNTEEEVHAGSADIENVASIV